jgi:sec-independent protein translocase protein TatA
MAVQLALPEGGEWLVLLVIVVLLVGANRLPDLTRNTARALLEFKKITRTEDEKEDEHQPDQPSATSTDLAPDRTSER